MGLSFSCLPWLLTDNSPFVNCLPCLSHFPASLLISLQLSINHLHLNPCLGGCFSESPHQCSDSSPSGLYYASLFQCLTWIPLSRSKSLVWCGVTRGQALWILWGQFGCGSWVWQLNLWPPKFLILLLPNLCGLLPRPTCHWWLILVFPCHFVRVNPLLQFCDLLFRLRLSINRQQPLLLSLSPEAGALSALRVKGLFGDSLYPAPNALLLLIILPGKNVLLLGCPLKLPHLSREFGGSFLFL